MCTTVGVSCSFYRMLTVQTVAYVESFMSLYLSLEAFFLTHSFRSNTVTTERCDVTPGFKPVVSYCQNTV